MTIKLPKVRNNLLEEMNPRWDRIVSKNTCYQKIFIGTEKKSKEIFLIFVSVCVVFFLTNVFLFRGLSIISSGRYFFVEAYPYKNICQIEIFVIFYLSTDCLLNKQSVSLCEVSKTLRIFKKGYSPSTNRKLSETTQNYLHHRNPLLYHRAMRHQILLCFSAVDFEHDFIIRKIELGKNGENIAMIMNHKDKL